MVIGAGVVGWHNKIRHTIPHVPMEKLLCKELNVLPCAIRLDFLDFGLVAEEVVRQEEAAVKKSVINILYRN